jgi:ribosome-associated translation inhibitor RaiA
MTPEKDSEKNKDISKEIDEYVEKEINKVLSEVKNINAYEDIDPSGYAISQILEETFRKPYIANDERQIYVTFKLAKIINALHQHVLEFQMLLDSGQIKDEPTREAINDVIIYLSSKIYPLVDNYRAVAFGVYNTRQNLPTIPQQNVQNPNQQ